MNHLPRLKLKVKNDQIIIKNVANIQMMIIMVLMMSILNLDVQVNNYKNPILVLILYLKQNIYYICTQFFLRSIQII